MENIKELRKEINLVNADIKALSEFLKSDRFDNGLKSLEMWIKLSVQFGKAKQAWGKKNWKANLSNCLDYDLKSLNKPDTAAVGKITDLDHKELKKWYISEGKFCVSPRTIVRDFTKKETPEKSDFEKMAGTLKTLDSQAQNYKLTELEKQDIVNQAKAILATIKKMETQTETEKAA